MASSLAQQAEDFANQLTATVRTVVGEECPAFLAVALKEADAFRVRQEPASGIILWDEPQNAILRLAVDYKCIYDGHGQYMAISKSKIHVFVEPDGRAPLFRYEYDRHNVKSLPSAHIQFHGTHAELEKAMVECGESTDRAKSRKRGRKRVSLDDLHLPVGGSRFLKPSSSLRSARKALADARETWRRTQIATVVRDPPSEAVATLEELGYTVTPPHPVPKDKSDKLRAL